MLGYAFVDGVITKTEDAKIPVDDVGFLRGYAIYEGITTIGTVPVFLEEHIDRLERSAKILKMELPYARDELIKIVRDMAKRVTSKRGDIRIFATGGRSENGISPGEEGSFYGVVNDLTPLSDQVYERGAALMTYEHQRLLPECKTTQYATAVMVQDKLKELNAIEVLYIHKGNVLEPSTSNIFLVKDNILITPQKNVLYGITRMKVIEIAKENNIAIETRDVVIDELFSADEVFITSTYKDVLPITEIDEKTIGSGRVGELINNLISGYKRILASIST